MYYSSVVGTGTCLLLLAVCKFGVGDIMEPDDSFMADGDPRICKTTSNGH